MKKLHLVSNAHLDPAWLWRWNEGLAEAISTFRVAADFCEEYDGYIFNHNEALLYEWVEEHEPALFARIQKLVKEGKWNIIGGWYLQPDCVMTSGESLLSQISLGRKYFKEKLIFFYLPIAQSKYYAYLCTKKNN
jgi:alpha-mannosidase